MNQVLQIKVFLVGAGAVLALAGAGWFWFGAWILRGSFPQWRLYPYLGHTYSHKRLFRDGTGFARIVSSGSVQRRLMLAGNDKSVREFRYSQFRWFSVSLALSLGVVSFGWLGKTLNPFLTVVLVVLFPLLGVMLPDYQLTRQSRNRQLRLNQELPDVIELLSLAVGAGESLYTALVRVSGKCTQVAGQELRQVVEQVDAGMPLAVSLTRLRTRNESEVLSHLVDAVVSALERGTPLSGVLREQVADSRAVARTQILAQGGRKEVWMMIPVVFLILPLTVVFALYPGLVALQIY